jgi:hypothetical protein
VSSRRPRRPDVRTGRLRAADPFELIRWLARSQTDPRKALAELVQNSLDAQARTVTVTRVRERGVATLRVQDDGEGVIPELARPEALAHVATHIGHSRKRRLTPEQRRELLLQGQYGIGLLGFWSIGRELEVRSQLGGEEPWVLRMWEDRPNFEVAPLRGRLRLEGTWTEVIVRGLHRPALVSLTGRRIGDYLAAELRGQLLERDVAVTVHDRMARGRAQKVRRVEPVRFTGERLEVPATVAVPGFSTVRVELYLVPEGGEPGRVAVASGGTTVYDDLATALDGRFAVPPWTAGRLAGLLDFRDFTVAPGSRRGVLLDAAADAFARAVETVLAPLVRERLAEDEQRRAAAVEADLVQRLERAFRDLPREAPEYDFLAVRAPRERNGDGAPAGVGAAEAPPTDEPAAGEEAEPRPSLFPPGPLARVEIVPVRSRVERNGERHLRARASDVEGARVTDVACTWRVTAGGGAVMPAGATGALFRAGDVVGLVRVAVTAEKEGRTAEAEAVVDVVEEIAGNGRRAGIPEPAFLAEPRGEWRSRVVGGRWEVNAAHRDYLSVEGNARRKLRYLAALLAKEIVLHSYPVPQGGMVLERMVAVLTVAERRMERG